MVITGSLEGGDRKRWNMSGEKSRSEDMYFREDVDVFRTSIRTATGTNQQEEKAINKCEGRRGKKMRRWSVRGEDREEHGKTCLMTSICQSDSCGLAWAIQIKSHLTNKTHSKWI